MNYERSVISEAKLSSLIALMCIPVSLILAMTIAIVKGRGGLEGGMYYGAFGPVVYIVFYGGLLYSTYEFAGHIFKRKEYMYSAGDSIYIAYYRPIKISEISNIYVENGLIFDKIVISKLSGVNTKIKAYLLKESTPTVLRKLKALIKINP